MSGSAIYTSVFNALLDLARAGSFRPCVFDAEGHASISEDASIAPAEVLVNEISSNFNIGASRDKSGLRIGRERWIWQVIVRFNGATVSCADFEAACSRKPPFVRAIEDRPQVRLLLQQARYEHPPYQQPTKGTTAFFTFEAELGPQ